MAEKKGPSRPAADPIKWELQVEGGRTVGPLSTEDLLMRISQGILTGSEKIRKLPNGQWNVVSREPIFYDKLLEALTEDQDITVVRQAPPPPPENKEEDKPPVADEEKSDEPQDSKESQSPEPSLDSENIPAVVQSEIKTPNSNLPSIGNTNQGNYPAPMGSPYNSPTIYQPQNLNIPQTSLPSEKRKSKMLGMVVFVVVIIFGYLAYDQLFLQKPIDPDDLGLHLHFPRPATKTLISAQEQSKQLTDIYQLIFKDSVEAYDQAQTALIKLIEKAPLLSEARGLLCVVQMELWPFVQQNHKDIENFKLVRMAGARIDPVGLTGSHCEIASLMVNGKFRDAMGMIEHTSNQKEVTEESPILYSVKAEVLASEQNFTEALAWAEGAAKLWPKWAHTYYQLGVYNFEIAQTDKAVESFEKVLFLNPTHRQTLIEYGTMIYLKMNDTPRAEKFLLAANKLTDPVPKSQEAKMYYYLAKICAEKNQNEMALKYVQLAYQSNPGDLKARDFLIQLGGSPTNIMKMNKNSELVFLGDQYVRAGDYLAAQAEYKAAFEIDPKNALAAMKAAKALWQLYQAEEAIRWLGKAIVADPKLSIPYYLMADYYSQLYNFQGAGEILTRGAQKLPNNPDILRGYGLVELRRNNYKQAISYLERALKASDDVETLTLLARAYSSNRDAAEIKKAMAFAIRAIQLEDSNPDAQIAYAKVMVVATGIDQAISYLKEKIQKFSYTPEYTLGLAEVYQEAEKYKDAQNEYEKIFLLDNKNKHALMGLGQCYQSQGILDKSLKMYLSAAVQDPSDPDPVFRAAQIYMEAGRYKDALTQFQRGVSINKYFPKGYYNLGRAALYLKEYNLAIQAANEEKKNNPNLADAYLLAGDIYREMRDYAKCGAEYQQAIRIRPRGASNYVKLAQCQLWAGNIEVAENMLAIAKDQESGYADIYKFQAAIFEKRNENQEACTAYQYYLTLSPTASDKKDIQSRIDALCARR